MLGPRNLQLDRHFGHKWHMTPFDFQVSRLEVNVTVTYCLNTPTILFDRREARLLQLWVPDSGSGS